MKALLFFSAADPFGGQFAAEALRRAGFEAALVDDEEACERAIAAGSPDLLVLDLCGTKGNGLTYCAGLRPRLDPQVPLLAVSVLADGEAARAAGAAAFLSKPLDLRELVVTARALADGGEARLDRAG